jgi:hypothetical protein
MGFASLDPSHTLSFLMLEPLFIWLAPDLARKKDGFCWGEGGVTTSQIGQQT